MTKRKPLWHADKLQSIVASKWWWMAPLPSDDLHAGLFLSVGCWSMKPGQALEGLRRHLQAKTNDRDKLCWLSWLWLNDWSIKLIWWSKQAEFNWQYMHTGQINTLKMYTFKIWNGEKLPKCMYPHNSQYWWSKLGLDLWTVLWEHMSYVKCLTL